MIAETWSHWHQACACKRWTILCLPHADALPAEGLPALLVSDVKSTFCYQHPVPSSAGSGLGADVQHLGLELLSAAVKT